MTIPAAETKSIGLLAFAQLSWFLQAPLRQLYCDWTTPTFYRDFATLTVSPGQETSRPSTGTMQKRMPTLTQTATPHTTGPL